MPDGFDDSEPESPLEGRYANYFQVGHSEIEFLLEFGQYYPDAKRPLVHTRIAIAPALVKELVEVIQESIRQYELSFGRIDG